MQGSGAVMMIRKSHIVAFTIGLIPFVLTMLFLNRDTIGPEISDKGQYIGCYGIGGKPALEITDSAVRSVGLGSSTELKRILSVKGDDAINTKNELIFDPSRNVVELGRRNTGFYYIFKGGAPARSLVVYDRQGNEHRLPKSAC
jgi:hypothetical protein